MGGLKQYIIPILNRLPYIRTLNKLLKQYEAVTAYPAGHYYSPVPNVEEIQQNKERIFSKRNPEEIFLNEDNQIAVFHRLIPYYKEFPYKIFRIEKYRYSIPDSFFTYTDAVILYSMIRDAKPAKIVEVGSGYSSALIMDVNQYFFEGKQQLVFIDPDFSRLEKLMKPGDDQKCTMIKKKIQEVDLSYFLYLSENDLLFIDSSHVSKTGSDLHYLLFEILPQLNKGVIIHFHDVYYPFEYPSKLVLEEKLAWNEIYLVRAFLMYNPVFEIVYFNNYLFEKHPELLKLEMPECLQDEGASLYIRKIK
ncbi:MAG TPA: class I SAM-dependent methyltransferase [Cytophagaceae bacterium]|jgi:hypothetical protein|nr:class I SAM-dependent methyltransferase [Cytophagaceae bacterium]